MVSFRVMPLQHGHSRAVFSQNVSEMMHAGHPQKQALAAAYRIARERAAGGRTPMAFGGMQPPPYFARQEARQMDAPDAGGPIMSEVPGRTDKLPLNPAAGSYVLPADVVSGLGEGNTLAGAKFMNLALSTGPHGAPMPHGRGHMTIPRPPSEHAPPAYREPSFGGPNFAKGGKATAQPEQPKETVPIIAAGGEYIIHPDQIAHHPLLGGLDPNDKDPKHYARSLKRGHAILDAFVKHARAKHIKTLAGLPGPKK